MCKVLEPISTEGMTSKDVPALRDRVRTLIEDESRKLQEQLSGA
jgi:hypothetical protein